MFLKKWLRITISQIRKGFWGNGCMIALPHPPKNTLAKWLAWSWNYLWKDQKPLVRWTSSSSKCCQSPDDLEASKVQHLGRSSQERRCARGQWQKQRKRPSCSRPSCLTFCCKYQTCGNGQVNLSSLPWARWSKLWVKILIHLLTSL